jgi:hypothetical protein
MAQRVAAGALKVGDTLREFGLTPTQVKALWDVLYVYGECNGKVEFEVRERLTGRRALLMFPVDQPLDVEGVK